MATLSMIEVDPFGADQGRVATFLAEVFDRRPEHSALAHFQLAQNDAPALFVAALDNDDLIGFAAFTSHSVFIRGERRVAYHAIDVATSAAHRGKGIFPRLVGFAEHQLAAQGAAFIFGFPNASAYPIWTVKLGYQQMGLTRWRAPAWRSIDALTIGKHDWPKLPLTVAQDDDQLIEWKRRVHGDALIVARNGSGLLWGIRQRQSVGRLRIPFLHLGGFSFDCRAGFLAAYREALAMAGRPPVARFEAVSTNPFLAPFALAQPQQAAFLKIIYKGLAVTDDVLARGIGMFGGIKDTF